MIQATYPFDGGVAIVQWPVEMTTEEYEDFKDWLKIIERKVGRTVATSSQIPAEELDAAE